jgi:transcriptional regulator with XRE-family HTH domain
MSSTVRDRAISERISLLRRRKGLTQTALGEMAGLSDSVISGYERGGAIPKDRLDRVATALGVTAADLLQGTAVIDLSADEVETVRALRAMPAEGQAYIHRLMVDAAAGRVAR